MLVGSQEPNELGFDDNIIRLGCQKSIAWDLAAIDVPTMKPSRSWIVRQVKA